MLDVTTESVTSALKRARAGLQHQQPAAGREPPPAPGSPAEEQIRFGLPRSLPRR